MHLMHLKRTKPLSKLLGLWAFFLLVIFKGVFPKPAFAFISSLDACAARPECASAISSELAPSIAAPTAEGVASTITATTTAGVSTTTQAAAGVTLVGDMRLSGIVAYHIWKQAQNGQAQKRAEERYCAAYPGDEVCNPNVVNKSFVEGYAYGGGCSTPVFVSLSIPDGQEVNIESRPDNYCGSGGVLAYYKNGNRFADNVFNGSFSIVTKNITASTWVVEGYAYGGGCSTPVFVSLPIPDRQETNIVSQPDSYCGSGGVLAYYKNGSRFSDAVFNGGFAIVNKKTIQPWKYWPQEKRSTAVALLTESDWQEFVKEMPVGGVLNPGDKVEAPGGVVIPGELENDPNTPEDERLPRKEPSFTSPPDFDYDREPDEFDTDDDDDGTPDFSDPDPQNPLVPKASSDPSNPSPEPPSEPAPNPSSTPEPGVGGNGTASEFGDMTGMSRADVDAFLRSLGATVKTTADGYTQYKFPDRSEVWIRPDGEVVRTPAPKYGPDGSRINRGLRLNKDGSLLITRDEFGNQIPRTHSTGEMVSN